MATTFLGVTFGFMFVMCLTTAGHTQDVYVTDTAFCKRIENKNCLRPLAAGQTYRIRDLEKDEDGLPIVYFWGKLRNPSDRVIASIFTREGECYEEGKTLPLAKIKGSPGTLDSVAAFVSSISLSDILGRAGFKTLSGGTEISAGTGAVKGKVDLKFDLIVIQRSDGYRVRDHRNVVCPGKFSAVLVDSKSYQLPPEANNDVKSIIFVP